MELREDPGAVRLVRDGAKARTSAEDRLPTAPKDTRVTTQARLFTPKIHREYGQIPCRVSPGGSLLAVPHSHIALPVAQHRGT